MGSTAVQIITEAYRKHNLDEVTTFSTSLEFPYKIAKDVLNEVIGLANRLGTFGFTETKTALTYGVATYTYSFNTLAIDPKRVIYIRREATNYWGDLDQINNRDFKRTYRSAALLTAMPGAWSKFGDTLELSTQPDQDYSLNVYHYKDMPKIAATTDTFLVPERDEDILIQSCYLVLGYYIGRWSFPEAEAGIKMLFSPFLVDLRRDSGIAHQLPANF